MLSPIEKALVFTLAIITFTIIITVIYESLN